MPVLRTTADVLVLQNLTNKCYYLTVEQDNIDDTMAFKDLVQNITKILNAAPVAAIKFIDKDEKKTGMIDAAGQDIFDEQLAISCPLVTLANHRVVSILCPGCNQIFNGFWIQNPQNGTGTFFIGNLLRLI